MNSMPNTTTKPAITPITAAPGTETASQPAVTATSPAREPLSVIEMSGLPYLIQVIAIAVIVETDGATVVAMNTLAAESSTAYADEPLKPYHPNQRMNTPSAPSVSECPGIALDSRTGRPFLSTTPSLGSYLPMRGPRIAAPTNAAVPPTRWTAAEPAKSWKPRSDSQPPPQIQCPEIG